jgi:hypothetical protein
VGAKGLCLAGPPRSGETIRPDSRSGRVEKLRCRRTRGGIVGLASGGRGLR